MRFFTRIEDQEPEVQVAMIWAQRLTRTLNGKKIVLAYRDGLELDLDVVVDEEEARPGLIV